MMCTCSTGLLSRSVMTDPLRRHGPQHTGPPCPSPPPGVCSDSCPWSQWCHPTILFSVPHFSSCLQSFPASESFPMSQFSHKVAKVLELQHQSFQWLFRTDFLQDWLVWSPWSPKSSQESSPTPQFKSINFSAISLFMVQLSHPYMTTGKTVALTRWTFVSNVSAF